MAKVGEDGHAPEAKKRRGDDKGAKVAKPADMEVTVLTIGSPAPHPTTALQSWGELDRRAARLLPPKLGGWGGQRRQPPGRFQWSFSLDDDS